MITRYSANYYFKNLFGEKIYRIALKGGITCPNRDGKCGSGGCIFCSEGGSGDFASDDIDSAIACLSSKKTGSRFIAYFQNYSFTYNSAENIKKILDPALSRDDIAGISFGTRPDCLDDEILELLCETNKVKPVWAELGLQTSDENTADLINRCYKNEIFEKAVKDLDAAGIRVIVHLIIGLPGETKQQNITSVKYINKLPVSGVKFSLLHVLKKTRLENMYNEGKFSVLSSEEYTDILCDCIKELREDIIIHRMTGDGPKKILVAPLWSGDKKRVINTIHAEFEKRGIALK